MSEVIIVGLYNVFNITGSSMSAQSIRLNTIASNLSNADVVAGSADAIYRAKQPVFAAVMTAVNGTSQADPVAGKASLGVQVAGIVENPATGAKKYQPGHPKADDNGYIYHSNVNAVEEMANMMSASRSYQNSVEVFNTSKQLLLKTLSLGK